MVQVMKKYRPANALGWILTVIGFGLMSLLKATSSVGQWVGFQFVASAGTGMIVRSICFGYKYSFTHWTIRYIVCRDSFPYFGPSARQPDCISSRILCLPSGICSGKCKAQNSVSLTKNFSYRRGVSQSPARFSKTSSKKIFPLNSSLSSLKVLRLPMLQSPQSVHFLTRCSSKCVKPLRLA